MGRQQINTRIPRQHDEIKPNENMKTKTNMINHKYTK